MTSKSFGNFFDEIEFSAPCNLSLFGKISKCRKILIFWATNFSRIWHGSADWCEKIDPKSTFVGVIQNLSLQ